MKSNTPKSTITVRNFKLPFSNLWKKLEGNQRGWKVLSTEADLIGIYGTFYLTRAENIALKCMWKTHQLDHSLGQKNKL